MEHSSSATGSTRTWLPIDQLLIVPDTHQNHPQLLHIDTRDPRNHRRYHYLSWQVTHPPTAVMWSKGHWYEFHHSLTPRQPYHKGHQIEVYPTPIYPDTEDESVPSINEQIRSTPAIVDMSGPGSPHRERNTHQGTPIGCNAHGSHTMSTQTLVTMTEVISRTLVPGGDDKPPHISMQYKNPQHIRDTFNIALGQAPGGPSGPRGPGGPSGSGDPFGGPNNPGAIPPTHLIPIQPTGDLKPAGIPPLIFHGDRT